MTEVLYSPDGTAAALIAVCLILTAGGIVACMAAWDRRRRSAGRHRDGGLWYYPRGDDGTLGEPRRMVANPQPFWWRPPGFKTLAGSSAVEVSDPRTPADDARPALPPVPVGAERGPGHLDAWPAPAVWEPGTYRLAAPLARALVGRDEEAVA